MSQQKSSSDDWHRAENNICVSSSSKWALGCQNKTIKNSLVKVLEEKPTEWPYIIDSILFAHGASKHFSTKYSPFFLLHNREPVLPVDRKYSLVKPIDTDGNEDCPFDIETFEGVLTEMLFI